MRTLIIAVLSLSLGAADATSTVLAQGSTPVISTSGSGVCTVSPSTGPDVIKGDWTITCGDIDRGSGLTVIGPSSVSTAPAPVKTAPAPEPAPAEEAPAASTDAAATEPEPVVADTAVDTTDRDGDNYPDALEPSLGLDPTNPDTDGDGVADGDEINVYGTDPLNWDTDGDGVSDGAELFDTHTDPLVWDDFSASAGEQTVDQVPPSDTLQGSTGDTAPLAQKAVVPVKEVSQQQGTTEHLTATNGNTSAMGTGNASSAPGTITRSGVTEPSILSPDGTNKSKDVPPTVDVPPGTEVSVAPAPEPGTEPAPVEAAPVDESTGAPTDSATSDSTAAAPDAAPAAPSGDTTDLDGDNYPDALEPALGLDPTNIDTDGDGVADGDEINIYGTDPLNADTDGDGVSDGDELYNTHTDPLVWNDFSTESGGKTATTNGATTDETAPAAEPVAAESAPSGGTGADTDGDRLSDADEAAVGTDPTNPDTDGDGFYDGDEVNLGTDPLDPASHP